MIQIKTISVELEKSLTHNYNTVRLRMGTTADVTVDDASDFESKLITLKAQLETIIDAQLLNSMHALPRLSRQGKELAEDIPY